MSRISEGLINKATQAKDPQIHYPIKNPFFPKDLKVLPKTDDDSVHCICKSIKQMVGMVKITNLNSLDS